MPDEKNQFHLKIGPHLNIEKEKQLNVTPHSVYDNQNESFCSVASNILFCRYQEFIHSQNKKTAVPSLSSNEKSKNSMPFP